MSDLTGELIDSRYRLTKIVASGGMATIYEAVDTRLDRNVAVKIMHPHLAQDEKFVERFIREAKAAAALSHPNIVSVLDQGWNQGGVPCVFIVMELIEGATLRDYIHEQGSLSVERSLQLLMPVASALAAAHRLGIVHRDIKPENILISNEGRIKIADFGLARGELLGTTMTAESSVILGSVSYLSPEQVQRGVADSRSDIYSLGIVFFECVTGQKPFQGDDPVQIAISHVNERVPAPSTLKPSLSPDVDLLVQRSTDLDPDKRPRDGGQFLEELRALSEKIDPRRRQLSLELDLPPAPIKESVRERARNNKKKVEVPKEDTVAKDEKRKKKSSPRVNRNRKIAALLALILGVAAWYIAAGPGAKVVVPSLAGATLKQATKELSDLGLAINVKSEEFSEEIPQGKIISSKPAGGGRIAPSGTVDVFISKGPERFDVPDLTGLDQASAEKALTSNSLTLGDSTSEFSSQVPAGYVVRSNPAAGASVKRNTLVSLVISKGIQQVSIADYKGKVSDQALNELSDAGFDVKQQFVYSEDLPAGVVISQTPGAGNADKGSHVTLIISKGSEYVFIPNIFSLTQAKAVATLKDLDLKVNVKTVGKKKVKVVTNVSPKVGTKVKRGSTVTITVG